MSITFAKLSFGTGVPGTIVAGNELDQITIAANQKMRRHGELVNRCVKRVGICVEPIDEQLDDARTTEFARWQADVVNDDEIHHGALRPCIEVGRRDARSADEPAVAADDQPIFPRRLSLHVVRLAPGYSMPSRSSR